VSINSLITQKVAEKTHAKECDENGAPLRKISHKLIQKFDLFLNSFIICYWSLYILENVFVGVILFK